MANRREFSPMVYAEIVRRAIRSDGKIICEGCGGVVKAKKYHVDHTIPDALMLDKKRKLTAADGKLLGIDCCHSPKTKDDVAAIAKAKRREAKHVGIRRPTQKIVSAPFPITGKAEKRAAKQSLPFKPLFREVTT
jgi:hypothetical protein